MASTKAHYSSTISLFTAFKKSLFRKAFQPEIGAYRGLARVLKSPSNPQNCRNKQKILEKGTFIFCAKPWYAPNPGSKEIWLLKNPLYRTPNVYSPKPYSPCFRLMVVCQARLDPLSRDRCSNVPVALCFSGYRKLPLLFSKKGSTPTPWARGVRDQIQKWAPQTQKTLYF